MTALCPVVPRPRSSELARPASDSPPAEVRDAHYRAARPSACASTASLPIVIYIIPAKIC